MDAQRVDAYWECNKEHYRQVWHTLFARYTFFAKDGFKPTELYFRMNVKDDQTLALLMKDIQQETSLAVDLVEVPPTGNAYVFYERNEIEEEGVLYGEVEFHDIRIT